MQIIVSTARNVKEVYVQQLYPQLIVFGDDPTDDILKKISSSDVLLFAKTTDFALTYSGIVELARIVLDTEEYSVFRKVRLKSFNCHKKKE